LGLIGLGSLFLVLTFGYLQMYNPRRIPDFRTAAVIVLKGTAFWMLAFLSLSLVLRFEPKISRIYMLTSAVAAIAAALTWRWLYSWWLGTSPLAQSLSKRVLFVGWTQEADRITERLTRDRSMAHVVAGWVPAASDHLDCSPPAHVPELGDASQIERLLGEHEITTVILADPRLPYEEIVRLANLCEKHLVEFKIIPSFFQILLSGLRLDPISGVPLLGVTELPLNRLSNRLLKRMVDILGSIVGLTLSAPIMAVCGVLIRLESPGPIFFAQERLGRNGRPFKMYKLRTMVPNAGDTDHIHQSTQREDPRLLRVGRFMRRWNLDEVPQFWNVLKGDMSLVGPRPERTYHSFKLREVIPHYAARLASKPGLTGWAQVNGLRGDTSLEERVRYDLHYLENWSLWFDFQTMFLTFLRRDNAY
ncbi:MAG TPA: sugar transferase, partial [Methylomirabilota bacterium]|nr:sugar transferase [Methylomirabilota bacterium]